MANSWLRLWHDMPNDPKWRTISRLSGESISLVLSIYTHLLVDASRNVTRGHVTVTVEDLASALDVTEAQVSAVLSHMEGRVIDAGHLSGWENRQVKREDYGDEESGAKSAAQRKKEQREREKLEKEAAQVQPDLTTVTQSHAASRNVTLDKDKEEDKSNTDAFASFWSAYPNKKAKPAAVKAFKSAKINGHLHDVLADIEEKSSSEDWIKEKGKFIPYPATYLNQRRWEDSTTATASCGILPGAI